MLKLILAGAAETEHVAILWYTVPDGAVGLHYHSRTESVYVIDGTQSDAKGVYPTGTVYFTPPGSEHAISDSSGFFAEGGMSGEFIDLSSSGTHEYTGNYVLVLGGSCDIGGKSFGEQMLVVAKDVTPELFSVTASVGASCLAMDLSF